MHVRSGSGEEEWNSTYRSFRIYAFSLTEWLSPFCNQSCDCKTYSLKYSLIAIFFKLVFHRCCGASYRCSVIFPTRLVIHVFLGRDERGGVPNFFFINMFLGEVLMTGLRAIALHVAMAETPGEAHVLYQSTRFAG